MTNDSDIARLRGEFNEELARVSSESDLQSLRDKYLGRKSGAVTALMKSVATAPPDLKPVLGKLANELKQAIEQQLAERKTALESTKAPVGAVDISLPGRTPQLGHRHPLTIVREQIEAIFTRLGYQVLEGPEIEDEYHNFEALNMPAEHPARDMQDTLYLSGACRADGRPATLLRTHTSPMQIRYMEIARAARAHHRAWQGVSPRRSRPDAHADVPAGRRPGRRRATSRWPISRARSARSPASCSSPTRRCRFRPSFFPYTEPSAEVFIGCVFCHGAGCPICKRTGWLEIGGSGMVHPAVFEAVGYDPDRYTGFAFGMGIERIAILKYGVDDIRLFYENDLRFLEQFPL